MNRTALAFILSLSSLAAWADNGVSQAGSPDIKRVISETIDEGACGLEPMQLIYEDSKGVLHTLDYTLIGSGCSNG